MPTAVILTLRIIEPAVVHTDLSRAAHAAVLRLIATSDQDLATQIHDSDRVKPLTVSNVLGLDTRTNSISVSPEQEYALRVTSLSSQLDTLSSGWNAATIEPLNLDGSRWQVEHIVCNPHDHVWTGCDTYEELARSVLTPDADLPTRWTLEFASPVTFRQRGLNQPLPLPDLVFGSLLEKWNSFAPLPLPEELRDIVSDTMAVSRFDLHSIAAHTKNRALQIGSVGRCTYIATTHDPYWLACIGLLARFAFYSGVGAGTARGFGRVRLLEKG